MSSTQLPVNIKQLASTAIPLMLASLSSCLMLFIDRLFLANYSLNAMNAAAATGMICSIFVFGAAGIASIAEIFVGRYHGAKQNHLLAQPIWHMIYFSLGCSLLFIPIAHFLMPHWIPTALLKEGLPYSKWFLDLGFLTPLYATLCAFFVGRNHAKIVFYISLLGNALNFALDPLFIFGQGNIPAMGASGAAMATQASQAIQCLILAFLFLQKPQRDRYQTHRPTFNKKCFYEQLNKGIPAALSHVFEMAAWSVNFHIAAMASELHITIVTMGQSLFLLVMFLTEGLSRAVGALGANCLGAHLPNRIPTLLRSALSMHGIILIIAAIPLIGMASLWLNFFQVNTALHAPAELVHYAKITSYTIWTYLAFDGLVWIIAGILRASGDTRFIFICNALCAWVFGVIPAYILVGHYHASPPTQWGITCGYALINFLLFLRRYRQGKWQEWKPSGERQ